MISPWCKFGNVANYLDTHPEANRLKLVNEIARGLKYLHARGVIHGDLKPQNVVVDDDGHARICDFGRSKIINHKGYTTAAGGSIRYMAPELLDDDELNGPPKLTAPADVYSFGMIILEVTTGRMPYYTAAGDMQVVRLLITGQKPQRSEYKSSIMSNALWELMESCWGNPQNRPSMNVIAERLSNV